MMLDEVDNAQRLAVVNLNDPVRPDEMEVDSQPLLSSSPVQAAPFRTPTMTPARQRVASAGTTERY